MHGPVQLLVLARTDRLLGCLVEARMGPGEASVGIGDRTQGFQPAWVSAAPRRAVLSVPAGEQAPQAFPLRAAGGGIRWSSGKGDSPLGLTACFAYIHHIFIQQAAFVRPPTPANPSMHKARRIATAWLVLFVLVAPWRVARGQPLAPAPPSPAPDRVPASYVHQQWTVKDGLPVNNLNDLLQTRDGYLWIATWDGLVRFDGARFQVFNVGNTDGLPSNRIIKLFESRDSTLWFTTVEPAAVVQYRAGRFITMQASWKTFVTDITEHWDDLLLTDYDRHAYRYAPGAPPAFSPFLPQHKVYVILKDGAGTVWVATDHGLYGIGTGGTSLYTTRDGLASDDLEGLHIAADGAVWTASVAGLDRYHDGRFTRIPLAADLGQANVPRFYNGADSSLWVAAEHALYRYDADRMRLAREGEEGPWMALGDRLFRGGTPVFQAPSLIRKYLFDHEGSLWVATNSTGLFRLKPAAVIPFGREEGLAGSMTALFQDRDGVLWFAGEAGPPPSPFLLVRVAEGRPTIYPGVSFVTWLSEDREGFLWVGWDGGLRRIDKATGRPSGARPEPGIRGLYEDRQGARWLVLAEGGVVREQAGTRTPFGPEAGFPKERVQAIHETAEGALWFITGGGGLVRYAEGRFTPFNSAHGLSGDVVRGFYEDADGVIWVGTYGRGLNRIDVRGAPGLQEARVTAYRVPDGLYDDVIHAILEDDYGRLWMSTNRGLFWVRREELNAFAEGRLDRVRSTSYDERAGMRNREANGGGHHAGLRDRQGRLWFPTQEGIVMVDPSRLQPDTIPPPVVIEAVSAGERVAGAQAGRVRLDPTERTFAIDYTGLSFLNPEQLRFRYKLEGFDDDWQEVSRRTAYYTQVPPGSYTFRVRAANKDGVWNETGAALTLTMAPFFYETGWFYALCVLAALLLGGAGYRARTAQLRRRQQELERLVAARTDELRSEKNKTEAQAAQLRELDQAKSRFFANVSHEFRTPLTLSMGPLEDVLAGRAGPLSEGLRARLDAVLLGNRRLLYLVNQLLDLARMEAGMLTLHVRPVAPGPYLRTLAQAFEALAERRRITFTRDLPEAPTPVYLDVERFEQVVGNLLSNAFKFTPEGGRVHLGLQAGAEGLAVEVRDNGPGIAAEHLGHLFDRFFRVDEARTTPGTGIGLSLARELAEQHGGRIAVESRPGFGTTFTVHLPPGRAHFAGRDDVVVHEDPAPPGAPARVLEATPLPAPAAGPPRADGAEEPEEDRTTVLVVDDNAGIRAYVAAHLQDRYRVVEAADGEEALERVWAAVPDLVVSDVMMPRLDGYGLLRALRKSAETDFVPVILLTARAGVEARVEGLREGADAYLEKPFRAEELRARVGNLIAQRQRLRQRFARPEEPGAAPAADVSSSDAVFRERLRQVVAAHLADEAFDVATLASVLAMDRSHLYRRVMEAEGQSPSAYLKAARLERAAGLLAARAGTVSEVAYATGFRSVAHFSRSFSEHFACLPSTYAAGQA